MDQEKWLELAELYAIDALDGQELKDFEVHLAAGDNLCKERIQEVRESLSVLPQSLSLIAPPVGLETKVMAQIEAHPNVAPQGAFEIAPPKPSLGWVFGLGFGVLALAAGAVFILNQNNEQKLNDVGMQLKEAKQQVVTLQDELQQAKSANQEVKSEFEAQLKQFREASKSELLTLQQSLKDMDAQKIKMQKMEEEMKSGWAEKNNMMKVLSSPGVKKVSMDVLMEGVDAKAQVYWHPGMKQGMMMSTGLPEVEGTEIYELWAIAGENAPVPVGSFTVDKDGMAYVNVENVPSDMIIDTFAVTLEPTSGLQAPSGPMYLAGSA